MTMYEFEVAAKNAVIKYCEEKLSETFEIQDISIVWACKTLGNKKAILIDNGNNNRLYECTFNGSRLEMYLDYYEKKENIVIPLAEMKHTVG